MTSSAGNVLRGELEAQLAALGSMALPQLKAAWQQLGEGQAPLLPAPLLRRLIAQQMQEHHHGALPLRVRRELEQVRNGEGASSPSPPRSSPGPAPGTRLIREWNGQTIAVEVRDDGYLWEGRAYRSLSEIARQVTGARWSGPRFFGLRRNG